jgi:hypothetical protein
MKRTVFFLVVPLLLVGLLLAALALTPLLDAVRAQGPSAPLQSGYDLSWWTVDGGGWMFSSGGGYDLGGTAGQPDAGWLSGGSYTLGGGFWGGGALAAVLYRVYLPLNFK